MYTTTIQVSGVIADTATGNNIMLPKQSAIEFMEQCFTMASTFSISIDSIDIELLLLKNNKPFCMVSKQEVIDQIIEDVLIEEVNKLNCEFIESFDPTKTNSPFMTVENIGIRNAQYTYNIYTNMIHTVIELKQLLKTLNHLFVATAQCLEAKETEFLAQLKKASQCSKSERDGVLTEWYQWVKSQFKS